MWRRIRGNAFGCLVVEPMFILPYNLLVPYASVYMLALGVGNTQIGWITSLGLILQLFTSLVSGFLTDRMGRRIALITFDVISWSVGFTLWAVSQNVWFFIAAAAVNAFQRVPTIAWYCLLVEDTPPEDRSVIFTIIQFINVLAGLIAPIGGLLVGHYGLVPATRFMYALAGASVTAMFVIRHFLTHETEIGMRKKRETVSLRPRELLGEYAAVFRLVLHRKPLLLIFAVYILYNFQMTIRSTYLSVYLIDHLGFRDTFVAWMPAVSSIAMFAVMMLVSPRLKEAHLYRAMNAGFVFCAAATALMLFTPPRGIGWMVGSTALFAVGAILSTPLLETAIQNALEDDKRANMFSILNVLILIFVAPAGIIGGWTYAIHPNFPFWIIVGTFLLSIGLTVPVMRGRRPPADRPPEPAASLSG